MGKALVSTYVAANAQSLRLDCAHDVILDIDSQFTMEGCHCDKMSAQCTCDLYAIPLRCMFPASSNKPPTISRLDSERQCKGEAEMAQVDWLIRCLPDLKKSSSMASFVTSGDIDAVYIHMFMIALWWPRDLTTRKFVHQVLVILQKPKHLLDVYNITDIVEFLESVHGGDESIGVKVSLGLCLGGNDFLPKIPWDVTP